MAVNDTRSMNWDLAQGAMDGTLKCLAPNQGGEVNETEVRKRHQLLADSGIYDEPMDGYDQAFLSKRMRHADVSDTHKFANKPETYSGLVGVADDEDDD